MTDDLTAPDTWTLPTGTTVPAGGFLVVWADDNTGGTALHASFKLSGGGEQIGLFKANGAVADTLTYGDQETDISYGRAPDGSAAWGSLETATPGAANSGIASPGYGPVHQRIPGLERCRRRGSGLLGLRGLDRDLQRDHRPRRHRRLDHDRRSVQPAAVDRSDRDLRAGGPAIS